MSNNSKKETPKYSILERDKASELEFKDNEVLIRIDSGKLKNTVMCLSDVRLIEMDESVEDSETSLKIDYECTIYELSCNEKEINEQKEYDEFINKNKELLTSHSDYILSDVLKMFAEQNALKTTEQLMGEDIL